MFTVNTWLYVSVISPVRHLLQIHFLLVMNQLSDVMPQNSDEECDEDYGQNNPQANTGV